MPHRLRTTLFALSLLTTLQLHAQLPTPSYTVDAALVTPYEASGGTETATYEQMMAWWRALASRDFRVTVLEYGLTDVGLPLHLVVIDGKGASTPAAVRDRGKSLLLINNAIHPGEPVGVDASMLLARDLLYDVAAQRLLDETTVLIIPAYNLGGMLNRGPYSRANQDGPKEHGFRGNARNYDLNRDFAKQDTRNARAFAEIFLAWRPHVFMDNHTTNGADYQHVMTLIHTQPDKLGGPLAPYLRRELLPALYAGMASRDFPMTPYVNSIAATPDSGLAGFLETPRYSTGYTALFNCLGFVPEAHMLKPYPQRVAANHALMLTMLEVMRRDAKRLRRLRQEADEAQATQQQFDLRWQLDDTRHDEIDFMGYTAKEKPSLISGQPRRYYDRAEPWRRNIPMYDYFQPTASVTRPLAYIIPQGWQEVVERLRLNGVQLHELEEDTELAVELYRITDFSNLPFPYEGHYAHFRVGVEAEAHTRTFRKGDYVVYLNQPNVRYIIEMLEPHGMDSFLTWNFFDSVLQQKEHFSSYVFEELALQLLEADAQLRQDFEARKAQDPDFAASGRAQLDFIYKRSPYYEPTHNLYPVGRLTTEQRLFTRPID